MKTILKSMRNKKSGIPQDKLSIFEEIVRKYEDELGEHLVGIKCFEPEWDDEFSKALMEHLTQEERFKLYEINGACSGTGQDKERKAFAQEYAILPLEARLELFCKKFGRDAVLNKDNTITVIFKCSHGYYKRAREGKYKKAPDSIESYFERCAGGRLYEYQKALGIKLKIKSVDVSSLKDDVSNPVEFIFEVVE